jgi:hypothetical protein
MRWLIFAIALPALVAGRWRPLFNGRDLDGGPRPESGYIALQHHDDKAVIWFREISVRPD